MDKKIMDSIIERQKDKIRGLNEASEELGLQERFLRRKILSQPKYENALGMLQKQKNDMPKKIKFEEDYLAFLEEIKHE